MKKQGFTISGCYCCCWRKKFFYRGRGQWGAACARLDHWRNHSRNDGLIGKRHLRVANGRVIDELDRRGLVGLTRIERVIRVGLGAVEVAVVSGRGVRNEVHVQWWWYWRRLAIVAARFQVQLLWCTWHVASFSFLWRPLAWQSICWLASVVMHKFVDGDHLDLVASSSVGAGVRIRSISRRRNVLVLVSMGSSRVAGGVVARVGCDPADL